MLEATNKDGRTPLHEAAMNGHEGVARLLLGKGATVEVKDKWGKTPLADAVKMRRKGVVRQLLAAMAAAMKLEE
jgi:ankyrin repeat protein